MRRIVPHLRAFAPSQIPIGLRETVFSCTGAAIGLLFSVWTSRMLLGTTNPWFIAPMGASAVLLFAAPSSPLAQPWSILAGNIIGALIGVSCAHWIANKECAAALAVGLTIAAMLRLRCLHPPSGAVALTAVLGGSTITELGYNFALWPVAANSLVLVVIALAINGALGRRYPHGPIEHDEASDAFFDSGIGFTREDLDAVLAEHHELLDISKDDLEEILIAAERRALQRRQLNP